MKTYIETRMEKLQQRLRGRTKADGTALPGFEQNVATIRAEMEQLSVRYAPRKNEAYDDGE